MKGVKYDDNKLRHDLLPVKPINEVIRVLMAGAKKYEDNNWIRVPDKKRRYYSAAKRHIDAWWQGEYYDQETNLPHLAHAICCLIFLLALNIGKPKNKKG